jgi:hypothetical protein
MGRAARNAPSSLQPDDGVSPMPQPKDDLSQSLVALEQHRTLVAVVELSLATWLVGGIIPGVEREPLKKLVPDAESLLTVSCCIGGVMRPLRPVTRSHVWSLPSKLAATASRQHAGFASEGSKRTSFIQRASRCHASSDHSRCDLHTRAVTYTRPLSEGFRHFVTSCLPRLLPAGVRAGRAHPLEKRRLFTAHVVSGRSFAPVLNGEVVPKADV